MSRRFYLLISIFFPLTLWAKDTPELGVEDRLYELEAEVSTLKTDLESTKNLATQERANAFNPSISVIGDMVGQYGFNVKEPEPDHDHHAHFHNGVSINEIEFEFRGDVDPFADALVTFALDPHGFTKVNIHLEEAYMRLKKWPGLGFSPLGLIIKAGKFRTAIGRMNRIHRHNINQINYPFSMRAFLGEEGHAAPGISLNRVFNPGIGTAINVTIEGVFNSRVPMQEKGAENIPSGVANLWLNREIATGHFLDVGISTLLGRAGPKNSGPFALLASDFHYSYIPNGYGEDPFFLLGNEFYAGVRRDLWLPGSFTWTQIRLYNATFFGVSYDFALASLSAQHALGAYLSHYTTEFLRFRLGYEHVMPEIQSFAGDHRLMLSMIFILGSHPVEPYFVNR